MYQQNPQIISNNISQSTPHTPQKLQPLPNIQISVSPHLIKTGNEATVQKTAQLQTPVVVQQQPVRQQTIQQQQSIQQQQLMQQLQSKLQQQQLMQYQQKIMQQQIQKSPQLLQQLKQLQQQQQLQQQKQIQQQQLQQQKQIQQQSQIHPLQQQISQANNINQMSISQQNSLAQQQSSQAINVLLNRIQIQQGGQPNSVLISNQMPVQNQQKIQNSQLQVPIITGSSKSSCQNINTELNPSLKEPQVQQIYTPNQQETVQRQDEEFVVEGIADEREYKGKKQYLVQWYGFPDDENTWEDESNLLRYYNLINDFKINGPKQRTQRRVIEFISGFSLNGKIFYNVLYQNDEVACISALQARCPRLKQQLLNFLEREHAFPEKERVVIPLRSPKPKSPESNDSSQNISAKPMSVSESSIASEFAEEEDEEEEDKASQEQTDNANNEIKKKKNVKSSRVARFIKVDSNIVTESSQKDGQSNEYLDELKSQEKILQEDPIEAVNPDDI